MNVMCSHKRNDEKTIIPESICIGSLFSQFKSKCQLKKKKKNTKNYKWSL